MTSAPSLRASAESIDNRVPVPLKREAVEVWLDRSIADTDPLSNLLEPFTADEMKSHEVSRTVNSPGNDVRECIAPV